MWRSRSVAASASLRRRLVLAAERQAPSYTSSPALVTRRRLRASAELYNQRRSLSTTIPPSPGAAAAPTAAAAAGDAAAAAASATAPLGASGGGSGPGFFSRNFGKIMLGVLATLIGYLYRSSENKKRSKALRVFLEDCRALEPWEIDDLRMANAEAIPDLAAFQEMVQVLKEAFPSSTAPYRDFIQVVSRTLAARGQRLQLAHYLDRAILLLRPDGGEVDLLTLLCALSLTLNLPLEERIAALHGVAAALGPSAGRVEEAALRRLIAGLVATAQVPAEALVTADPSKGAYPFQAYRVATVEELADKALRELNEAAAKAKPPQPPLEVGPQGLSAEELTRLLATKAVCAWGECYQGR